MKLRRLVILGCAVISVLAVLVAIVQVVRWKAYIWLPDYFKRVVFSSKSPVAKKHVIFTMVDHFEPGKGEEGVRRTAEWVSRFSDISTKHVDASGNHFRYSWFYPFDHHNEPSLKILADAVYDGYGEVDLHWHHPPATNETFPTMLAGAIAWYQRYGLLLLSGDNPVTGFGFIHGSWGVDDSYAWMSGGKMRRCGVRKEIDILRQAGCYGDFTFPSFGNVAQPSISNAIFFAVDTPEAKSYDKGEVAAVGRPRRPGEFMIFQGPLGVDWSHAKFEYSAVESYDIPTKHRIKLWIDSNIHVTGRPDWVFVKVFSHGMQSRETILKKNLEPMLGDLEAYCREKGYVLHYVTAREAYNLVRAAENGKTGDPESYRDYSLAKPCASLFKCNVPVRIYALSPRRVSMEFEGTEQVDLELKGMPVLRVTGTVKKLDYRADTNEMTVSADGAVAVEARQVLKVVTAPTGKAAVKVIVR